MRFRDVTSALKAEAMELQRQLKHLQYQYDMLTGQTSASVQGRRSRVAATSTVNGQLTNVDDSLSARNLEVTCCLNILCPLKVIYFICYVLHVPQFLLFSEVEKTSEDRFKRTISAS